MGIVSSSQQSSSESVIIGNDVSAEGQGQGKSQQQQPPTGSKSVRLTPTVEALTLKESTLKCPVFTCKEHMSRKNPLESHIKKHVREIGNIQENLILQYHCPADDCVYNIHKNDECFLELKKLKQHYCKVHLIKGYTCDRCDKKFATAPYLREHQKSCGIVFECSSCPKKYKCYVTLQRHAERLSHTYDVEKYRPRKVTVEPMPSSSTRSAGSSSAHEAEEYNQAVSPKPTVSDLIMQNNYPGFNPTEKIGASHQVSTKTVSFHETPRRVYPSCRRSTEASSSPLYPESNYPAFSLPSSSSVPQQSYHPISESHQTDTPHLAQNCTRALSGASSAITNYSEANHNYNEDDDSRDSQALIICEDAEVTISSSESSFIAQPSYERDNDDSSQDSLESGRLIISENETRSTQTQPELLENPRPAEPEKTFKTPRALLPAPPLTNTFYILIPVNLPVMNDIATIPKIDFGVQTVSPPKNVLKSQHCQTDQHCAARGRPTTFESMASRVKRKRSAETQTGRVRVRISAETQTSVVTKRRRCTRKKLSTQTQTHTPTNQSPVKLSPNKSPSKKSSVWSSPNPAPINYSCEKNNILDLEEVNSQTQTDPNLLIGENFAFEDFEGDSLSELLKFVESKSAETQTQTESNKYLEESEPNSSAAYPPSKNSNYLFPMEAGSSELFEHILNEDSSLPNDYLVTMDSETQTPFQTFRRRI